MVFVVLWLFMMKMTLIVICMTSTMVRYMPGKELFTQLRLSRRVHRYYPCGLVSLPFYSSSLDFVSQIYVIAALLLTYSQLKCVQFHTD